MAEREWTPRLLAIHEAIVGMGMFQEPLEPSLVGLTLSQWQLERARRVLAALEALEPPLWEKMGYDERSIREGDLD